MFYAFNQIFLRNQELCSPPSIFQQCNLIFLFAPGSSARNCLDGFADLLRTVRATIQVKFIHYGVHIFTNSAPLVIYTIFLNLKKTLFLDLTMKKRPKNPSENTQI